MSERPLSVRLELGNKLKELRAGLGMTLEQVETVTDGVASRQYVEALENGEVKFPAPYVLFALAGAYVYSYEKLMLLAQHIRPNPLKGEIK